MDVLARLKEIRERLLRDANEAEEMGKHIRGSPHLTKCAVEYAKGIRWAVTFITEIIEKEET